MTIRDPVPPAGDPAPPPAEPQQIPRSLIREPAPRPATTFPSRPSGGEIVIWVFAVLGWLAAAAFGALLVVFATDPNAREGLATFSAGVMVVFTVPFAVGWTALGILVSRRRRERLRWPGVWIALSGAGFMACFVLCFGPPVLARLSS